MHVCVRGERRREARVEKRVRGREGVEILEEGGRGRRSWQVKADRRVPLSSA